MVTLQEAAGAEEALLANLLELYVHDLSAIFTQVELGEDGRFGYPSLPEYLRGDAARRAFVVRVGGRVAGFVLARRGSAAVPDPDVWDVAEFFVLRRFRGCGVGREAARALWQELGGAWTVRVANENVGALAFWRRAVAAFTGSVRELVWSKGAAPWTVFHLQPNE